MRKVFLTAALCTALPGAQLAPAPAFAAELVEERGAGLERRGGFAGARLRVPLGSTTEKARVGLALTGVQRGETGELRFTKGLELGFARGEGLSLASGGRTLRLAPGGETGAGRKAGVSTLGWVAIGIGAAVVVSVVGYGLWLNHELNDDDRCCE